MCCRLQVAPSGESYEGKRRLCRKQRQTTAGLPRIWRDSLHVTCGLTACTPGSAPGPTLGNEYGKTLPFLPVFTVLMLVIFITFSTPVMLGLGLVIGLRPQNFGLGLGLGLGLCLEYCGLGLAGQVLALALADALKLQYMNRHI